MKKVILPVLAFAAIIVASCAKEKDGYDKNLTKDTWTLSSLTSVDESVEKDDYTDQPDVTVTTRKTQTVSGGQLTNETYGLNQTVGTTDQFQKVSELYDYSQTYKFENEGTYTSNESVKLKSVTTSNTANPTPTTQTVTAEATTSSNTGIWAWANTGDQKALFSFDKGSLQVVSIKKDAFVLKLNTSSTEVTKPAPNLTKTETNTKTIDINFSK